MPLYSFRRKPLKKVLDADDCQYCTYSWFPFHFVVVPFLKKKNADDVNRKGSNQATYECEPNVGLHHLILFILKSSLSVYSTRMVRSVSYDVYDLLHSQTECNYHGVGLVQDRSGQSLIVS